MVAVPRRLEMVRDGSGSAPDVEEVSGPVVEIRLDRLRAADSPRAGGEDPEHVRVLTEAPDALPPIVVHRSTMRVVDGMHRLRAAGLRGQTTISARLVDGPEQDMFLLAVRLNVRHGLPLLRTDRAAAAVRVLETHPHLSDRAVASVTGLAARTVAKLRTQVSSADPGGMRISRDGRSRPLTTAGARRDAGRLLSEHPEMSLRQVARRTGLSVGTVRDVRRRVSDGEDPVPPRQHEMEARCAAAAQRPVTAIATPGGRGPARLVPASPPETSGEDARTLLERLRIDPSLRLSAAGRLTLRLLDVHHLSADRRQSLAAAVPAHCVPAVGTLARRCAEAWMQFAVELDARGAASGDRAAPMLRSSS